MTPELARHILPYVQAIADGKTVQRFIDGDWFDVKKGDILDNYEFRINYREPPKSFFLLTIFGSDGSTDQGVFNTREEAYEVGEHNTFSEEYFTVTEVTITPKHMNESFNPKGW